MVSETSRGDRKERGQLVGPHKDDTEYDGTAFLIEQQDCLGTVDNGALGRKYRVAFYFG